jgi:hypothetical protein
VSKIKDPAAGWPHKCGAARSWVKNSETQLKVICSFCRKHIGTWNFIPATEETKTYPADIDAKFSTEQKKNLK